MIVLLCQVLLGGAALPGTMVQFIPEKILGDASSPPQAPPIDTEWRPWRLPTKSMAHASQGIRAIQVGLYKVQVAHPEHAILPKFNTETMLGQKIANDSYGLVKLILRVT